MATTRDVIDAKANTNASSSDFLKNSLFSRSADKVYFIDEYYLDRLATNDTINFINKHLDFFYFILESPQTLIDLMETHHINQSRLINQIKNAFDEDRYNISVWTSVSNFRIALYSLHYDEQSMRQYLDSNPAMNRALVGENHDEDPIMLAWYGKGQKRRESIQIKVSGNDKEPTNTDASFVDKIGLFAAAILTVSRAIDFLSKTHQP